MMKRSKAEEIKNTTGCKVIVDVLPTWKHRQRWTYQSPGYAEAWKNTDGKTLAYNENNVSTDAPTQSVSFHETPQKRMPKQSTPVSKADQVDPDIYQIYKITYGQSMGQL